MELIQQEDIPHHQMQCTYRECILHNATVALRTANVLPNATLATRYDNNYPSGVINIDKASIDGNFKYEPTL
jgi:hypothetical protein